MAQAILVTRRSHRRHARLTASQPQAVHHPSATPDKLSEDQPRVRRFSTILHLLSKPSKGVRLDATAHVIASEHQAVSPREHAAYALCAQITRTRARNFYYGLRLLPEPKRSAMYSIYAWMRAADDAVDEAGSNQERQARLAAFRQQTDRVLTDAHAEDFASGNTDDPQSPPTLWLAFRTTVQRFPLERRIFLDTLDGMEDDLRTFEYQTEEELSQYCYRVACTVGLACVRVWGLRAGVNPEVADELAILRGQAFQRTNILRDFKEDFDSEPCRTYIPRDAMQRAGLTAKAVRAWSNPDACRALILEQAALARSYYTRSAELENLIQPDSRPTLWAMTRIYSGILAIIEDRPERIITDNRVRLSSLAKSSIALRATARARLGVGTTRES